MNDPGHWRRVLAATVRNWIADDALSHSAAVSFYSLFSLAPTVLGALSMASVLFGRAEVQGSFVSALTQFIGRSGATVIELAAASSPPEGKGPLLAVVGAAFLVFGATSVFGQLQVSLNQIWGATARPNRSGWAVMLGRRTMAFGMLLVVGVALLLSLILSTFLNAMLRQVQVVPLRGMALHVGNGLISLAVITPLFALLFKAVPDVRQEWRSVWEGAFVTALLFSLGRILMALYLGHSGVTSIYGTAGSLVALLLWIYYSAAILFFGAEFVRARHLERGRPVVPKSQAVLVRRELVDPQSVR